jgi:hypothetical protein
VYPDECNGKGCKEKSLINAMKRDAKRNYSTRADTS